jgi:PAS domain S-box-containing protein
MTRPLPLWRSLRLRLPLLISMLITAVLAVFVWTIDHELEQALLRAGGERAQAAADQLSALMAQSATRGVNEARRVASDPTVRDYAVDPSTDPAPARQVLTALAAASQPPVELWSATGARLLQVEPARGKATALEAAVPLRAGLTPFHVSQDVVFFGVVAEVHEAPPAADIQRTASAPALGYVVVRRTLAAAQTTDTINHLVGSGAFVAIGNQSGGTWSNFSKALPAPPVDTSRTGLSEYRTPSGDRRLGALSLIPGTPWAMWIDFPRDTVLGPAHVLRRRMLVMGLVFVGLSALLVSVVSARITRPLHALTTASAAMAAGEYTRVGADRRDEIGQLGVAFNTMTDRVEAAYRELEARVRQRTASLTEASAALEQHVTELNAAREELDRFFSLSLDLLCIAGVDGRFHRVNPAWEETLGWTAAELTAVPYLELVHPDDRRATSAEAADLAGGGTTLRFENRYLAKDGSYRWLSWKAAAAAERGLIYAAARDITDEKRTAFALEQHVIELKAMNDELEAFSYSVSHDLRAPLRHIVGFASLLAQSSAALNDEGRRYVKTIIEAANRMGALIDDLLAFSRVSRTKLTKVPVNLTHVVRDAQREVVNGAEPTAITWRIHDLPRVEADPALLRLVFVNLLSNAIKYSAKRPQAQIEVGTTSSDRGETIVFVRDNGIGFDMQYAPKLFGVFQRLHSADDFAGTGIGLANVRRIIQRHGGRTWAEGVVDGGATFYVSLPSAGGIL